MPGLKSMLVAGIEMKPLQHVLTVSFERGRSSHILSYCCTAIHSGEYDEMLLWYFVIILSDFDLLCLG